MAADLDVFPPWEFLTFLQHLLMFFRLFVPALMASVYFCFHEVDIRLIFPVERGKRHHGNDPLNLWEATLTPHYFRHNFVTMLYRAGVDPLKAMKIVGHNEYQTTADIYTHLDQEMMQATA